jgi:hypothetical protein
MTAHFHGLVQALQWTFTGLKIIIKNIFCLLQFADTYATDNVRIRWVF